MEMITKENFLLQAENILSKSFDKIIIVGKGPSADKFDFKQHKNASLIINLNDSQEIINGDICIFHSQWVLDRLDQLGFNSLFYLSPFSLDKQGVDHIQLLRSDNSQESQDLLFERLKSDFLEIENYLFLTALKVSNFIANSRNEAIQTLMVGFDFTYESGYSKKIDNQYYDKSDYAKFIVNTQKTILEKIIAKDVFSSLQLFHIGKEIYSKTPNINKLSKRSNHKTTLLNEKYIELVKSNKVIVTAEFTTNHFGELDNLVEMVHQSKLSGADLVKVQKREVETFYTQEQLDSPYQSPYGNTFREYRNQLELNEEKFNILNEICLENEIPWFVSTLDKQSYDFIKKFNCPLLKLPSTISEKKDFLISVAEQYNGDIIISTGMTEQKYENFITETFKACNRIFLLQCNSAYPTPPEDCNIAVINRYSDLAKSNHKIIPGYSSHDIGSLGSCMAVAAGAKMIEKHVKLGSSEWAHFDSVALDLKTSAFIDFVSDIRLAEKIFGSAKKVVNPSEHHKY